MEQAIRTYLEGQMEAEQFAGAICAVSYQGKRIASCSVGMASAEADRSYSMSESTIVDLASVTKIYVATLMLKLISDGRCALHTHVDECLPEIKDYQALKKKMEGVTVKQLLTHSSGIQAWFPFYTEDNRSFYDIITTHIHVDKMQKRVEYSDINFILIGKVIEQITRLRLDRALNKYLAKPLKMTTLTYGPIDGSDIAATSWGNEIEQQMCQKRNRSFSKWRATDEAIRGEVNDGNCHYYFHGISGHAGLFSGVQDVLKLGELYLKGGEWDHQPFIRQELIHQSMQAQVENRGLGWEIGSIFPEGCGHTGFTGTSIWIVPERDLTVALLTNRLHVQRPTSIQHVRAHVHDIVLKSMNQREGLRK